MMENECNENSKELNFYGSDPGAVKFGNFINYYSFHDVKERLDNLHPMMLPPVAVGKGLVCLDVGCNTGELTKALYEYLELVYPNHHINILAVDIDPNLIQRAKESNLNDNIQYATCNIMDAKDRTVITNYLNSFKKDNAFHITFCFSVTMWIHLNNGDEGLLEFLKFIKNISKTIVIEPQPWKCYRNAQRRISKSGKTFDHYKTLKIKSDVESVIENVLSKESHCKVYESHNSSWNRRVQAFNLKKV